MNSIVEEIKARIDIVDLIAEHVDLKRAGQNYKGLCPFHSEKTPSFMVSPSKQIFHCFGCNKGGDMFSFIMQYENLTFQEAASYLSMKAGIKLEDKSQKSEVRSGIKEGLFAIYKEALIFFQNNLKASKQALSYLKERGLNSETVEKFSIGHSQNEKGSLFSHLKTCGVSIEHIKVSGLVVFGEKGTHDFFRDRLMFPIFDLQGRCIAFGGRILSSTKNMPKYINSPDSIIFKKGDSSYALNSAKNHIVQKGYSIIVEGYLDVIMCHQYGFMNTVAPLGTALTSGQIKKLKRFSDKTLLVFDGDPAGISATKRSLDICYAEGMVAKILLLPQGEDPDTFLRKNGEDQFRKYMSRTMSPVEFMLKVYGKNKLDAVRYILQLMLSCPDSLQIEETIRELSDRSKINEKILREEFGSISQKRQKHLIRGGHKPLGQNLSYIPSESGVNRQERMLLSAVLSFPDRMDFIIKNVDVQLIGDAVVKRILEKIRQFIVEESDNKGLSTERLLSLCSEEEQKLITMLSIDTEIERENVDENIGDCLKAIALKKIERQIKLASETGDARLLRSLLAEKKGILRRKIERSV